MVTRKRAISPDPGVPPGPPAPGATSGLDASKAILVWQFDAQHLVATEDLLHMEVFGHDPEHPEWSREPARHHVLPDDLPTFDAGLRAAEKSGTVDIDVRIVRPNGEVMHVATRGQLFFGEDGVPVNAIGAAVDVTDLRLEQAASRAAAERRQLLLDLSDRLRELEDEPDLIAVTTRLIAERLSADRCFMYRFYENEDRMTISPGFRSQGLDLLAGDVRRSDFPELLRPLEEGPFIVEDIATQPGFSPERRAAMIGTGISSFVAVPLGRGSMRPVWGIAVAASRPRAWDPAEVDLVHDVAQRLWPAVERARAIGALRSSRAQLKQANAELGRLNRGLEQLVAERTAELSSSEVRFRQAFELGSVAACLTDESCERLSEVNRAFVRLTGIPVREALSVRVADLGLWPERSDRERLSGAFAGEEGFEELEMKLRAKDGTLRDVVVSGVKVTQDGAPGWLLHLLDVTDRNRSQEELMRAIQEVMTDTNWFSRRLVERLAHAQGSPDLGPGNDLLSSRERQVLTRVARGLTNEEIAVELKISARTVRNHIANIYGKIDVHSRAEAVVWARERGLTG